MGFRGIRESSNANGERVEMAGVGVDVVDDAGEARSRISSHECIHREPAPVRGGGWRERDGLSRRMKNPS